ncbi:MAG TPA: lysylphosphatidylglycerol synthase transmembrane domain-containing protein, partial [Acidimicrobiia bacterium]
MAPETTDAPELPRLRLGAAAKIGVRVIISAVLLVLLIIKIPSDSIQPKDTHAGTLTFLAVGIAVTLAGFVLSAWRWQRVFAVFDTHVPLRTLLAFYLAGQFVGNVLPSTIGGDVLRVSRAAKATGTSDVAFASVVIERLTGFVALPVLTVLGFVLEPSLREASDAWIAIAIAAATVGG